MYVIAPAAQHSGAQHFVIAWVMSSPQCLKYTPTPVTMVDGEGFVVMQNAASITSIGIQG